MKRFLASMCTIAMIVVFGPASTAAPHTTWGRQIGQALTAVAVGPDGSIYLAGALANDGTLGETKALLVKLTPAGDVVWTRTWLPSDATRSDGSKVWTTGATAVAVAPGGAIYLAGSVQRTNLEGGAWFIRKYAAGGRLLYAFAAKQPIGRMPQYVSAIAAMGDRVVVAGHGYGCCDDPTTDGWVRAFDPRLHPTWRAQFEPPAPIPTAWYDMAEGVAIDAGGNVFVSGWAATSASNPDTIYRGRGTVVLEKLSSTGDLLWSHRTTDTVMRDRGAVSVAVRGDRVVVSAPIQRSKTAAWLGRFSLGGALLWSRTWGSPKFGTVPAGVAIDPSMTTWVVGTRHDPTPPPGTGLSIRRFDADGNALSALLPGGGIRFLSGSGIAVRGAGAVVTGSEVTGPKGGGQMAGHVWRIVA
ncbi:MAG TPA: hypothetical protein VK646_02135 [Actinomycetota bacterium]|nr:hypothetical protein [Actinomycetota bacterium]